MSYRSRQRKRAIRRAQKKRRGADQRIDTFLQETRNAAAPWNRISDGREADGAGGSALPVTDEFIEALADALAIRLATARAQQPDALSQEAARGVDAATLAARLGVSPQWVRDHA